MVNHQRAGNAQPLHGSLRAWDTQGEGGAGVRFAPDVDASAMQLRDFAHEREAQAGTGDAGILYSRDPVELFEDAGQVGLGNAVTMVGHFDGNEIAITSGGDR